MVSLEWASHGDVVASGFSRLRRGGTYADVALWAEGRRLDAHRAVLASASPLLRDLLLADPRPVDGVSCLCLADVSFATLRSLLDYAYLGEVAVPEQELNAFLDAAHALRIRGLNDDDDKEEEQQQEEAKAESGAAEKEAERPQQQQQQTPKRFEPPRKSAPMETTLTFNDSADVEMSTDEDPSPGDDPQKAAAINSILGTDGGQSDFDLVPVSSTPAALINTRELQYTVSSRGSLQLILNRFMYNLFSKSDKREMRKWRCVDYRDRKCPACCITQGNVVVKRTNMHIHPFHDKKIFAKMQKKAVFSAVKCKDAPDATEKE